jgi:hypothetical protein
MSSYELIFHSLKSVPSPPCGIATGTPIFANAPCEVENVELKEKGLNF